MKENKSRGITLISLVVTIIVLLILAGVSIAVLTGENGIINRATQAKETTDKAQDEEQVKLAVLAAITGGKGALKESNLKTELKRNLSGVTDNDITGNNKDGWTVKNGNTGYYISSNGEVNEAFWFENTHGTIDRIDGAVIGVKIGDYINDTETQSVSGFDGKWRVLGVENGKLLLVTDTFYAPFEEDTNNGITRTSSGSVGPNLYGLELSGKDGYDNGVARLDKIGEQYNNSKLEKGRSIKIDDINKITGYNPNNVGVKDPGQTGTGTPCGHGGPGQYKNKVTYKIEGGMVWFQGTKAVTTKTQSEYATFKLLGETNDITSPYMLESTAYTYCPTTLTELFDDTKSVGIAKESVEYDMLFNIIYAPYWIASDCVWAGFGNAQWGIYRITPGSRVDWKFLWSTESGPYGEYGGVRAVVQLKSNINPSNKVTDSETGISTYEI